MRWWLTGTASVSFQASLSVNVHHEVFADAVEERGEMFSPLEAHPHPPGLEPRARARAAAWMRLPALFSPWSVALFLRGTNRQTGLMTEQ
jgi:hypothetical protein